MNARLEAFARQAIKDGLAKCSPGQQLVFKMMYFPQDLGADINLVVDQMPAEKLDWAMQQVDRTKKPFDQQWKTE